MAAGSNANLGQYLPPGLGTTLNNIKNPTVFGEQLLNQGKQAAKAAVLGIVEQLKQEISVIVDDLKKLEIDHRKKLIQLKIDSKPRVEINNNQVTNLPPLLTQNEYEVAVAAENALYEEKKEDLKNSLKELRSRLKELILGPYKKFQDKAKKYKTKRAARKNRSKLEKRAAQRAKIKQFVRNIRKTLVAVLAAQLGQVLIRIITNNSELQDLVNRTNEQIEAANTLDTINQARMARNACIAAIDKQEKKVEAILKTLKVILLILTVLQVLILVLKAAAGIIGKIFSLLHEITFRLLNGLTILVSISIPLLESAIEILRDLKRQLRDLNRLVEQKTLRILNNRQLAAYLNQIYNSSTDPLSNVTQLSGETYNNYIERLRQSPVILQLLAQQNPTAVPSSANQLPGELPQDYINRLISLIQNQNSNINAGTGTNVTGGATGLVGGGGTGATGLVGGSIAGTNNLNPLPNESQEDYINRLRNLLAFLELLKQQNEAAIINRLPGESESAYIDRMRSNPSVLEFIANRTTSLNDNNIQEQLNALTSSQVASLAKQIQPTDANSFPPYKQFRFQIKQEDNPKFVVRGNKRHYAVAINTKGIEQIKSDYSFTLDPQQLVDQLKVIIDQQNLQG
jgi:hypothetical protein